ncbi:MAG: hydrogenase 4 subunit B [Thiogranum sp.]|jgi:formate hydrogenlyase subunit 3/multisubunit Na+/H+ antiporter MnhD subunit
MSTFLLLALTLLLPLLSGVVAFAAGRWPAIMRGLVFPLLGAAGLMAVGLGGHALLRGTSETMVYALGLPWLHWHLRVDPLAGFFLALIGFVVVAVSLFGPGYVREFEHGKQSLAVLGFFTGLFVSGMLMVVVAADAFSFMLAWELMSLSSYFLVVYQHRNAANRRAGFLYLLMAEVGALTILLGFGVLAGFGDGFSFAAMREAPLTPVWASIAFALGVLGFGMKAGLVPLHAWLPEAHPVAPSHISALMSGVMLKVAVYGFIRFSFDLIGNVHWAWGVALLVIASITAVFGVLYALMQHDLKRLLAYSSVENIGIIFIGLGLSMIFYGTGFPLLGTLGLVAALYHTLSHALFKSLLFLGAGAVLQRSHERDLDRMGGLLRRMPWTGLFFLVGCISISALPPFNGFVSEWLTFQTALQVPSLESGVLRAVIPLAAAALALTGALAAACFVKVYGTAFLGQARTRRVRRSSEAGRGMLLGQAMLALACLLSGIFPTLAIDAMANVTRSLTGQVLPAATAKGWLWLTPISADTASYSAPLVFVGMLLALLAWAVVNFILRPAGRVVTVRSDAWDCGFGPLSARMQYTATSFSMPIRRIFAPLWPGQDEAERDARSRPGSDARQTRYQVRTGDVTWKWFYQPVVQLLHATTRRVSRIQTGNLRHYLAYTFVTLLLLLWLIT